MKKLTHLYSALMHAHKDRVLSIEDEIEKSKFHYLTPVQMYQEYCTLRLDGGRQSGKTTASVEFAHDWILNGGHLILIGHKMQYNREFIERLHRCCEYRSSFHMPDRSEMNRQIHQFAGIRTFLGDNDRFRGLRIGRPLVLIDEPMDRLPDIRKIYEKYHESVYLSTGWKNYCLPIFMVIGCQ
ncbi:hypothetical protein [Cronobacter phage vB_Cdu_VP8]|nr:hypothetical protein [Cronobacter phage vB_Cdu_VP8]